MFIKKEWTKEEYVLSLKQLSEALGGARPTVADLIGKTGRALGCPSKAVLERLFGSYAAAVEAAGLSDLPTAEKRCRAETFSEARKCVEEFIEGKKLLLRGEKTKLVKELAVYGLTLRVREELIKEVCRKRGVRILKLPNDTALNAVVSWIVGQPYLGVLPKKELVEIALGEEVARLLRMAVELGSLAAAARAAGYGASRISRMVISASRKTVKRLMGRVPLRERSI